MGIAFVSVSSDLANSGCLVRVIEIIMEALSNDIIITKRYPFPELIDNRDIYYRDPVLFVNQGTVDRIVDVLAYTLLIPSSCLHVVSS